MGSYGFIHAKLFYYTMKTLFDNVYILPRSEITVTTFIDEILGSKHFKGQSSLT